MPLHTSQEEFIQAAIEHLLIFPTDADEFVKKAAELSQAMTNPDPANEFYRLHQCILNPSAYLQNLEKIHDEPITIADVQGYILTYITNTLYAAAEVAGTAPEALTWNYFDVFNLFIKPVAERFVSQPIGLDAEPHPFELPFLENSIYSRTLRLCEPYEGDTEDEESEAPSPRPRNYSFVLDVEVVIHERIYPAIFPLGNLPAFENNNVGTHNEREFYRRLHARAEYQAQKYALQCTLDFLSELYKIHPSYIVRIKNNINAANILIHPFYLNLIIQDNLRLSQLLNLSASETSALKHDGVISLLTKNLCTFEQAKRLYSWHFNLLSNCVYMNLLKNRTIDIENIIKLRSNRVRFLLQPPVSYLMHQAKLSFPQALKLPLMFESVLISRLYIDFFRQKDFDWENFKDIKLYHVKLLLHPDFALLIKHDFLKMEDIIHFTEQSVINILAHPLLLQYTQAKLLNIDEIQNLQEPSGVKLYAHAFAVRIFDHLDGELRTLNGTADSLERIMRELPEVSQKIGVEEEIFFNHCLILLLVGLRFELQQTIETSHLKHLACAHTLLAAFPTDEQLAASAMQSLQQFIEITHALLQSYNHEIFLRHSANKAPNNHLFFKRSSKRKFAQMDEVAEKALDDAPTPEEKRQKQFSPTLQDKGTPQRISIGHIEGKSTRPVDVEISSCAIEFKELCVRILKLAPLLESKVELQQVPSI